MKLKLKSHFICQSTKIYYLLNTFRKQRECQNNGHGKSPIIFFWIIEITLLSLIFVLELDSFMVYCPIWQLTWVQNQLLELQSKLHKTIVFITHDLDESLKLGDHIGILNDGKLVQVGKPEEIIMNPADDYVAAFVKDVNRAKVLRAKTIMLSPEKYTSNGKGSGETHKVLENSFIEEFLPLVLEKRSVVEVIDKDGNTMGFITEKELGQSLSKT